jgi:anti-sigma regulatory factor (Ser/Thr protein kinase)
VLAGHGAGGEFLERAELLVSEVVTNAVVHAGTPVWLSVSVADGVVHIEAEDGGGGWVARREPGNLRGPCAGYGLWLVDSLAESWGVEHGNADNERQGQPQDGRTKTKRVWLRLLLPL